MKFLRTINQITTLEYKTNFRMIKYTFL